jgi:acyl dehydratase
MFGQRSLRRSWSELRRCGLEPDRRGTIVIELARQTRQGNRQGRQDRRRPTPAVARGEFLIILGGEIDVTATASIEAVSTESGAGRPVDPAAHTASKVGHHYRMPDFYEIGREKVREYSRAVQNDHPAHISEDAAAELGYEHLVAPATFISVVGIIAQKAMFDEVITGYDLSQIMQADQRLEFHRPIVAGDRLTVDVSLDSFRQMGGSDIIITKNIVTDEAGGEVMTSWTTLVARSGGGSDQDALDMAKGVMKHDA